MKSFGKRLCHALKGIFIGRDGKVKKVRILILSIIFLTFVWGFIENGIITVSEYEILSSKLPESFSGYKIAQISDLHNKEFGKDNRRLLKKLEGIAPDIIVITGDIVDASKTDIPSALEFCKGVVKIAPTYYVSGNHEGTLGNYMFLESSMESLGVKVLKNEAVELERNGERITLAGIKDSVFGRLSADSISRIIDGGAYSILLSHRPERFSDYVTSGADLVFTGHAHGGQFRIPLVGGVIAPNQGLFPEYDSGLYESNGTNMLVSRGLGNSIIPIRINNMPEIVVAELRKGQ